MILFYFRSDENGNRPFPAFSIEMNHDSRYVDDLRILESIELYLNSVFYAKHSSFVKGWIAKNVIIISFAWCSGFWQNQNGASEKRNTQTV